MKIIFLYQNFRAVYNESLLQYAAFIILEVLVFSLIYLICANVFKKNNVNILSFCDFEGGKKKNKIRKYITYVGYNFSVSNIKKTFHKAIRYYKTLIKNGQSLLCFEKEMLKSSLNLMEEYDAVSKNLNSFDGKEFFEGIPVSVVKSVEDIHCNINSDKNDLSYKVARLIVISGYYYISLFFSGKLSPKKEGINYRLDKTNAGLCEKEKLQLKKFYRALGNYSLVEEENAAYRILGEGKKNHFSTNSADLIIDEFGNFCYFKDGKCVCEFGKFNLIKAFNFKIKMVIYTDKFCIYENEKNKTIKICLDIEGDIVLSVNFGVRDKIFSVKILDGRVKFIAKTNFLHSGLIFENNAKILQYRISRLVYNNTILDTGIKGSCLNYAFKGALKALKYHQLFQNVKIITIVQQVFDNPELKKILKLINLFSKFNFNYYVIAISDTAVNEADECFKIDELSKQQISFLQKSSVLFFDGKKYKFNLNFIKRFDDVPVYKTEPFFNVKNTKLKDLVRILYSIEVECGDSVFDYVLKNICDMSREKYETHQQNILKLFSMQTLEGLIPDNFKRGFVNFESPLGLLSALYYLYSFIYKYNENEILKEEIKYSTLCGGFELKTGKISDPLEYHMLISVQYLISENSDIETGIFKLFVLKKITALICDNKIKKDIFNYTNNLTKEIGLKLSNNTNETLQNIFEFVTLKVSKNKSYTGLSKIINLFDNNNFKDFESAVLSLNGIKDKKEKFLSVFLLKQYLTENLLGIKFNKNLISFNANLPKEFDKLELEIKKAKFTIGYFGYFGIKINNRRYYNCNYISLDNHDTENLISVG